MLISHFLKYYNGNKASPGTAAADSGPFHIEPRAPAFLNCLQFPLSSLPQLLRFFSYIKYD